MDDGREMLLMKKSKGSSMISNFTQLLVNFHYSQQLDFDLLAVYLTKDPKKYGLIYFGSTGSLSEFPYILLEAEENDKTVRITDFSQYEKIWLVVLDYDSVLNSTPCRMTDGVLSIIDNLENEYVINLSFNGESNMYVVGQIDCSNGTTHFNTLEKSVNLQNFEKLSDLLDHLD